LLWAKQFGKDILLGLKSTDVGELKVYSIVKLSALTGHKQNEYRCAKNWS
tara:strand:- start:1185 stop:1334 length:150 start_codon:yes stop_codon:yes gene_type:complete